MQHWQYRVGYRTYTKSNGEKGTEYGIVEAFFNDKMDEIIDLLKEKELLVEDQSAQVVLLEDYDLQPALIMKQDGATLYITRDLAAALYRKREYNFEESLYRPELVSPRATRYY